MPTRIYKIFTASTATGNNVASLRVVRAGVITGVLWQIAALSGATVDLRNTFELSLSNVSNLTTNDTPNNVISSASISADIASSGADTNFYHGGLAFQVDPAQTISINVLLAGTAAANMLCNCYISVLE